METKKYKCSICKERKEHRGVCWECRNDKSLQIQKAIHNREIELEKKRKYYNTGIVVKSINELLTTPENQWFYIWGHKPIHKKALLCLQTYFLISQIERGVIRYAQRKMPITELPF